MFNNDKQKFIILLLITVQEPIVQKEPIVQEPIVQQEQIV